MMKLLLELFNLLLIDLLFVAVVLLLLIPLFFLKHAAFAVLKRNFVGYFNNPIGYVFLCLFVIASSFAAFWPPEFFTANLANLDQLNRFLPAIMLVFIPTITMSIWSEERRQGTDELLLTLPAADFDIVIGKYLAAAAIFTTSLLFSQISNFIVLLSLAMGEVDTGLFITTYVGYWMTGLAMIAIGMVASFLTRNLTIGFILGLIFNLPLVFMQMADLLPSRVDVPLLSNLNLSRVVSNWSIAAQFDPFGRGVISLSSIVYFVMLMIVGLYLSMALIGARHWYGGRDGHSLFWHYLVRSAALLVMALGITAFFAGHDRIRFDFTQGKVSSLSADTRTLVEALDPQHPIHVDAFISRDVPEQYVRPRLNLLSMLKEFEAMAGDNIRVNIHDNLEPFSEAAALAEEQFGIRPRQVRVRSRGAITEEEVILGAAFRCGLQKVVVPFFDYGIPIEYELIRSINTVAQKQRKTIGIVRTDARLLGGITFVNGQAVQVQPQAIVEELEKQYDVEDVELMKPVDLDRYDLLLAVQPSSLLPEQLEYLLQAIRRGMPTAIFEDPLPASRPFVDYVPATGVPRQSPAATMGMREATLPKADIRKLWQLLGIESSGRLRDGLFQPDLVWQEYNPYPKLKLRGIPDQMVFVREDSEESTGLLNEQSDITSGLSELFFPFPGQIEEIPAPSRKFTKLVSTRELAGTITYEHFIRNRSNPLTLKSYQSRSAESLTIAAMIESDPPADQGGAKPNADKVNGQQPAGGEPIKVIYCADIDLMIPTFLQIRARPDEEDIRWEFENVTFILNIIDTLAGDDNYINIRKRKPMYATLQVVESRIEEAKDREFGERAKYQAEYEQELQQAEMQKAETLEKYQDLVNDLLERQREGQQVNEAELLEKEQRLKLKQDVLNRRFAVTKQRLERELQREIKRIQRDVDLGIQRTQFKYKFMAVAIPWIPPFLVGLIVFVRRRLREREGIEKSRLR